MVDGGDGPLAVLGLDAAPLDAEAVGSRSRARRRRRRRRRPTVPRVAGVATRLAGTAFPGCAPTPTSRCSSCRPRSGGLRWRCPTRIRRESGGRRWCHRSRRRTVSAAHPAATFQRCPRTRSTPSVKLLDLEPIEVNIFRGVSPDEDRQRIFGGQVVGQALVAVARTIVEDRRRPLPARLLPAGGRPAVPVLYEVDRLRDGGSSPPGGSWPSSTAR